MIDAKLGDLVVLKSGGPEMRVAVTDRQFAHSLGHDGEVMCTWCDEDGQGLHQWFTPAMLMSAVPS